MMRTSWLLAVFGLCLSAAELQAQAFILNPYTAGGYVRGGALTYTRGRPGRGLSVSVGAYGFARGGYVFDPFAPGYYGAGFSRFTSVTIVTPPPPPPSVVVVVQPQPIFEARPDPVLNVPDPLDEPLPGEPRGGFRPLDPGNRERALKPAPLPPPPKEDEPKPKKEEPKPPPKKEGPKQPEAPRPKVTEDPRDEYARLLDGGRESFAAQEYGRAAQRFRQATRVAPAEPLARFLLAQTLLALGKYHEAADAVVAGVERFPDWPTARFRPIQLYGANVVEYSEHLRVLEATLTRHPDDPVLLFLQGYGMWFDGRREEARPFFRRAKDAGFIDKGVIDRFLLALPAEPVL